MRDIVLEETPQHKIVELELTPPSESKNPQDMRRNEAQGEVNITEEQVKNHEIVEGVSFMDTAPLATVACLLTEIVARLGTVIKAVDELGERANFTTVGNKQTMAPPSIGIDSCSEISEQVDQDFETLLYMLAYISICTLENE